VSANRTGAPNGRPPILEDRIRARHAGPPNASVRDLLLLRGRVLGRRDLPEQQGDGVLELLILLRLLRDIGRRAGFLLDALCVRLEVTAEARFTAGLGGFLAL